MTKSNKKTRDNARLAELFQIGEDVTDNNDNTTTHTSPLTVNTDFLNNNEDYEVSSLKYIKFDIFDVPSDNTDLLTNLKVCLELIEALKPLKDSLGQSRDYITAKNFLINSQNRLTKIADTTIKEAIESNAKLFTRHYLKNLGTTLNLLLIEPKISLNKLSSIVNSFEHELGVPIKSIGLNDIEEILNCISEIFSEIKLPQFKPYSPVIAPRLFEKSNLTKNSSSRVMDIFFCICVSKSLPFTKIGEAIQTTKKYTNGDINLIFREAIEDSLIRDFGIDTYKIFNLLVCYWYDNLRSLNSNLTVSVNDLLDYAERKNKVVKETETSKTKKLTKEINYAWIAHHIDLLKSIRVYSPKIVPNARGKKAFAISETPLIEFSELTYSPSQLDINGNRDFSNVRDIIINFKIGKWFEYFNSENYLREFGYCHKEAIASEGNLSHLLNWLSFKLEHNQTGNFKVITILEQIGFKENLEEINRETNPKKKSDLKRNCYNEFKKLLKDSDSIQDPYQWEYQNPPQWLLDDTLTKPRGKWWDIWLNTVIVFKHPLCLIGEGKEFKREKIKPVKALPEATKKLTVEDLKSALASYSDNPNVSIRKIATHYDMPKSTLSTKIKSGKLTQKEIEDLINVTHFLGKKKK